MDAWEDGYRGTAHGLCHMGHLGPRLWRWICICPKFFRQLASVHFSWQVCDWGCVTDMVGVPDVLSACPVLPN